MKKKCDSNRKLHIEQWHIIAGFLVLYDILAVNFSYLAALWIRHDGEFALIPAEYLDAYTRFVPVYSVACIIMFWAMRM